MTRAQPRSGHNVHARPDLSVEQAASALHDAWERDSLLRLELLQAGRAINLAEHDLRRAMQRELHRREMVLARQLRDLAIRHPHAQDSVLIQRALHTAGWTTDEIERFDLHGDHPPPRPTRLRIKVPAEMLRAAGDAIDELAVREAPRAPALRARRGRS